MPLPSPGDLPDLGIKPVSPALQAGSLLLYTHARLCPSLEIPQTIVHQAPLSKGFPRQEYWNGLPFPSSGDLPNPGTEPKFPALQADSLPLVHWEAPLPLSHLDIHSYSSVQLAHKQGDDSWPTYHKCEEMYTQRQPPVAPRDPHTLGDSCLTHSPLTPWGSRCWPAWKVLPSPSSRSPRWWPWVGGQGKDGEGPGTLGQAPYPWASASPSQTPEQRPPGERYSPLAGEVFGKFTREVFILK